MTLIESLKARNAKINERLAAIEKENEAVDVNASDAETRLASLEEESRSLVAERASNNNKIKEITRGNFSAGQAEQPKEETNDRSKDIEKMSMRDKMAMVMGRSFKGGKFTEAEKRALGTAYTTTATTYVAATAAVDGVNNAGVFISTKILLDLLKEEGKLSPIFKDINFLHVKGLVEFPYRETRTTAKYHKEAVPGKDGQMKWAKLDLAKGYLQNIIVVTDEVLALTEFDLGAYIVDALLQDLEEDWIAELIYGEGGNDSDGASRIKGITYGATAAVTGGYDVTAANFDYVKTITDAIKLCTGKYRKGAKVYLAQDIYDAIFFSLDKNGNFRYPVFNNATGISSLGTIRVEVDENLAAGDFIVGNVNKFYKANCLIDLRIETERKARQGVTEYIGSQFCAAAPFPNAFIYGTKSAN